MALIVEDGTGLADAESYCSAAEAATYHNKRGSADAWDAVDDKEAALRKATDYMVSVYRQSWAGYRLKYTQALDWPRVDVPIIDAVGGGYGYAAPTLATDVVPMEVKNACAELALRSAAGDLLADEDRETKMEKVGPITVEYRENSSRQTRYAAVDAMLAALFDSASGSTVRVLRA